MSFNSETLTNNLLNMSVSIGHTQDRKKLRKYCFGNVKKFLCHTTLHALKYVGDDTISFWERSFFLCSFLGALITTANLISNIYAKWDSTPVIIGISPSPTSILEIPFPAITICNMNQALLSKVANYSKGSPENVLLRSLCQPESDFDTEFEEEINIQQSTLKMEAFVINHAQPCSSLLINCEFGAEIKTCSELFREVITDEGLCCVFNMLHANFLYKGSIKVISELAINDTTQAVDWNPETGYQKNLPLKFYPRRIFGTGISIGLSVVLYADVDDYFCSTTNGPGFKVSLHNPIETPDVKEAGLTIPIGFETRFRIDTKLSEAVSNIRSINRNVRQCVFKDEEELLYYKYYTRRNCESECESHSLYKLCNCIPFNLPLVYANSTICSVRDVVCLMKAKKNRNNDDDTLCRKRCLPSCFDLTFQPDAFSSPLAWRNYMTPNPLLRNMSKDIVRNNMAVIHFYFKETIFHGDLKNVYIGLTEFLSNTGGIMGLFMGFSIISVVEIFYFSLLRPIFEYIIPNRKQNKKIQKINQMTPKVSKANNHIGIASKILEKYKNSNNIGALNAATRFTSNITDEPGNTKVFWN